MLSTLSCTDYRYSFHEGTHPLVRHATSLSDRNDFEGLYQSYVQILDALKQMQGSNSCMSIVEICKMMSISLMTNMLLWRSAGRNPTGVIRAQDSCSPAYFRAKAAVSGLDCIHA